MEETYEESTPLSQSNIQKSNLGDIENIINNSKEENIIIDYKEYKLPFKNYFFTLRIEIDLNSISFILINPEDTKNLSYVYKAKFTIRAIVRKLKLIPSEHSNLNIILNIIDKIYQNNDLSLSVLDSENINLLISLPIIYEKQTQKILLSKQILINKDNADFVYKKIKFLEDNNKKNEMIISDLNKKLNDKENMIKDFDVVINQKNLEINNMKKMFEEKEGSMIKKIEELNNENIKLQKKIEENNQIIKELKVNNNNNNEIKIEKSNNDKIENIIKNLNKEFNLNVEDKYGSAEIIQIIKENEFNEKKTFEKIKQKLDEEKKEKKEKILKEIEKEEYKDFLSQEEIEKRIEELDYDESLILKWIEERKPKKINFTKEIINEYIEKYFEGYYLEAIMAEEEFVEKVKELGGDDTKIIQYINDII